MSVLVPIWLAFSHNRSRLQIITHTAYKHNFIKHTLRRNPSIAHFQRSNIRLYVIWTLLRKIDECQWMSTPLYEEQGLRKPERLGINLNEM